MAVDLQIVGREQPAPADPRISLAWPCNRADAVPLTIAFGKCALRCLRGSSKHRSLLLSLASGRGAEPGAPVRLSESSRVRRERRRRRRDCLALLAVASSGLVMAAVHAIGEAELDELDADVCIGTAR